MKADTNTAANVRGRRGRFVMTAEIVIIAATLSRNKVDVAGEVELSG